MAKNALLNFLIYLLVAALLVVFSVLAQYSGLDQPIPTDLNPKHDLAGGKPLK